MKLLQSDLGVSEGVSTEIPGYPEGLTDRYSDGCAARFNSAARERTVLHVFTESDRVLPYTQGAPMSEQLLRVPDVCKRIGMSRAWLYKEMSEGRFPKPFRLGMRATAWRESVVDAWINARAGVQ